MEPYIIGDGVDTGPDSVDYHFSPANFIGLGGCGGGLGEKISVKRRWVHKISADIPLDQAALIEPLSVGYHAVDRSSATEGDTALITGAGPIGPPPPRWKRRAASPPSSASPVPCAGRRPWRPGR